MKTFILIITLFVALTNTVRAEAPNFLSLDEIIKKRWDFVNEKNKKLQQLKILMDGNSKQEVREEIIKSIYFEYRLLNFDSAFYYCKLLLDNAYVKANIKLINEAKIKLVFLQISGGLFKEGLDTLHSVKLLQLDNSLWHEYYYLMARAYFDLSDYTTDNYYSPTYVRAGLACLDSAIKYSWDTLKTYSYNGLKSIKLGEFEKARSYYEQLIKSQKLDMHQYAIETSSLSFVYENLHLEDLAVRMLIEAAIADIKSATKETNAIRILARYCFQKGDFERAYRYIKIAHEDASYYGARQRNIQVSSILPQIEEYQLKHFMEQKKMYFWYSVLITVLIILIIVFTIIIFRQYKVLKKAKVYLKENNKRLLHINKKLYNVNRIKDGYISYFFDTISRYINRIESYKVFLHRKITSKQYDDIAEFIKTIDIKKEKEDFYRKFDAIFLSIFPHFLDTLKRYFKDETLLNSNTEHTLSPEIRILALIRIGISENEKIAQFLGYSLNTVYTYKARIKSKLLISMEELDQILMDINSIGP